MRKLEYFVEYPDAAFRARCRQRKDVVMINIFIYSKNHIAKKFK